MLYPDGGSEDGTAERHLRDRRGDRRVHGRGTGYGATGRLLGLRDAHGAAQPEGELVGFTKVTRDFSARRAVEASLRRERAGPRIATAAEEAKRLKRLLASVSHELRTPLNAISARSRSSNARSASGQGRANVERLQRSGRHLLAILDDVLEMSRAEAGQMPISPAVRRLGPAIQGLSPTSRAWRRARRDVVEPVRHRGRPAVLG